MSVYAGQSLPAETVKAAISMDSRLTGDGVSSGRPSVNGLRTLRRLCLTFLMLQLCSSCCVSSQASTTQVQLRGSGKTESVAPLLEDKASPVAASEGIRTSRNEGLKQSGTQPRQVSPDPSSELAEAPPSDGTPPEAESEVPGRRQRPVLQFRVYDILLPAFLINLGLVAIFLVGVYIYRLCRAALARRALRMQQAANSHLTLIHGMPSHLSLTQVECIDSAYLEDLYTEGPSTTCSSPRVLKAQPLPQAEH
ncbi:hypothetical protein Efla_007111 [Eimeria flavescens]